MNQKRISAPKTYFIKRKESKWITKPVPGPHNKNAIPLNVLLKDIIKIAKNTKEVKKILNKGSLLVDGIIRKNHKFPVGFLDVISIPLLKKNFRIFYDTNGRLIVNKIKDNESQLKIVRIKRKIKKGNKYQITTNDGKNFLIKDSIGKKYKTNDSLLIKIPSQEIIKHLIFKENSPAIIIGGKHVGKKAIVGKEKDSKVSIKIDGKEYRTTKDYVFIISNEVSF